MDNNTTEQDRASRVDELRALLQGRWQELTHEDFESLRSEMHRLASYVQRRYGIPMAEARKQVAEFEQSLRDEAAEIYHSVAGGLSAGYRDFTGSLGEFIDDMRVFGMRDATAECVRRNPLTSLAIAFGVGFLCREALRRHD